VPLSEDEQRILQDIERNFYEQDPSFARAVSRPGLYRHAARNAKLAAVGFVLGLTVILASFTVVPLVAFVGFLVMMASAGFFAQNIRRIGSAGMLDVAESERGQQVSSTVRTTRSRLRHPFHRDAD
jgi:hypothetical protein